MPFDSYFFSISSTDEMERTGSWVQCALVAMVTMMVATSELEGGSKQGQEVMVSTRNETEVEVTRGRVRVRREGYHHEEHHYKPHKRCYQCSYSPPKKVYEVGYEHHDSYGGHGGGGGGGGQGGGHGGGHGHEGYGYKSHYSQPVWLRGGWDKCLGPFDHYQAKAYGVDTWDCHYGNCYVRRDRNGDVFRGCYKGEYGVDQNKFGCHHQGGYGGSIYCFCYGELCNNGPVPYGH